MATIASIRGLAPIITAAATVTSAAISMAYALSNHSETEGAYYAEATKLALSNSSLLGNANSILYQGASELRSYCGVTPYPVGETVLLPDGETMMTGVVYSTAESLMDLNLNGAWDVLQPEVYDGSYGTSGSLYVCLAVLGPIKIRNIQRYDLNYADAKAKIDELMQ